MRLRILTYNMHKGFCFYSRQYVLRELRAAIRQVNADVVFLQEVMGVHPVDMDEGELDSQFEYLATRSGHTSLTERTQFIPQATTATRF